jgi:hypothetical protein
MFKTGRKLGQMHKELRICLSDEVRLPAPI